MGRLGESEVFMLSFHYVVALAYTSIARRNKKTKRKRVTQVKNLISTK